MLWVRIAIYDKLSTGGAHMGNRYNGYAWSERVAKFKDMQRRIASGELTAPEGPCQLCGDPGTPERSVTFEYHDEDYSREYSWNIPAAYVLCHDCHITRRHQRFTRPKSWATFLAHVRRGGYASEMKQQSIKSELAKYRKALDAADSLPVLDQLRPYQDISGQEWFARIHMDPASLADGSARPRP